MTNALVATRPLLPPNYEAVRLQLKRILESDDFRTSTRLSDFLRFIVEETLEGRCAEIKGYSIAVSVFDRPTDFNPAEDPIVRIYAGKLRRALAYYYETAGAEDSVRIHVPKGRYVPSFSPAITTSSNAHIPTVGGAAKIAVLLLTNLTEDPEQDHFAHAITEELVVGLTGCQGVDVFTCSVNAEFKWTNADVRDVARSLGTSFVLGGTVRRCKDRVRITAQLRDGISRKQLWAESYERTVTSSNLLAVQIETANRIVTKSAEQLERIHGYVELAGTPF